MVDSGALLKRYTFNRVSGVRIPPSPPVFSKPVKNEAEGGYVRLFVWQDLLGSVPLKSGSVSVVKIYPQKRNSQVVGYSVYVGVSFDGRRERRFVTKIESAENFVRVQTTDPRPVPELFDRKAELL